MHYEDSKFSFSFDLPDGWTYMAPRIAAGIPVIVTDLSGSRIFEGPNGLISIDVTPVRPDRVNRASRASTNARELVERFHCTNVAEMVPSTRLGEEPNTIGHEYDEAGQRHATITAVRDGLVYGVDINFDLTTETRPVLDSLLRTFTFRRNGQEVDDVSTHAGPPQAASPLPMPQAKGALDRMMSTHEYDINSSQRPKQPGRTWRSALPSSALPLLRSSGSPRSYLAASSRHLPLRSSSLLLSARSGSFFSCLIAQPGESYGESS